MFYKGYKLVGVGETTPCLARGFIWKSKRQTININMKQYSLSSTKTPRLESGCFCFSPQCDGIEGKNDSLILIDNRRLIHAVHIDRRSFRAGWLGACF